MHPVAVLTGGLGTRVAHLVETGMPKALIPVAGTPFVDVKLASLADAGARDVVLLVSHGADALRAHVGDGARFGLSVVYETDGDISLGTGGAVRAALDHLGKTFWVTYGDTLLDVPIGAVEAAFASSGLDAYMTVYENADAIETSNVDIAAGLVTTYEKPARRGVHRFIDYGMLLFDGRVFHAFPSRTAFDLGDVIISLVSSGSLGAFPVSERFWHVGTEEAWRETDEYLRATRRWAASTADGGEGPRSLNPSEDR